jgi:hypothetical protein
MALQTPTPAPMTANPGRPSRLRVRFRRLRFALRRDPLAGLTSPALAIRLADELLAQTAIAQPDTEIWCSVAVRPLAALLHSASPAGAGHGIGWVHNTVSAIHDAEPADPIWDDAQTACNRPVGSVELRTTLPCLRGLEPRQRRSVTLVMRHAVATLR